MSYEYVPNKETNKESFFERIFKRKNKQATIKEKVSAESILKKENAPQEKEKIFTEISSKVAMKQKEINNSIPYNKRIIDSMDGYTFEKYCTATLIQGGFSNVRHTKLSGDFGVDILAEYDGKRIAIQCKRYSKPVGVKAVQEVLSGAQYYECEKAMIISNQTLTAQAVEMAQKTNTLFVPIENLVALANNTNLEEQHANDIMLTDEQLKLLAMSIYSVYTDLYINIEITNISVNYNEVIYVLKKKENVRLKKITSVKNETIYNLGIEFEIRIDYERQNILLCFTKQNIEKWIKRHEKISESKKEKLNNTKTKDSLLDNAAYLVVEKQNVSIGMLMRTLKIGYDKANVITEQLEEAGIIGEKQENGSRDVLMTMKEYETYLHKEKS